MTSIYGAFMRMKGILADTTIQAQNIVVVKSVFVVTFLNIHATESRSLEAPGARTMTPWPRERGIQYWRMSKYLVS